MEKNLLLNTKHDRKVSVATLEYYRYLNADVIVKLAKVEEVIPVESYDYVIHAAKVNDWGIFNDAFKGVICDSMTLKKGQVVVTLAEPKMLSSQSAAQEAIRPRIHADKGSFSMISIETFKRIKVKVGEGYETRIIPGSVSLMTSGHNRVTREHIKFVSKATFLDDKTLITKDKNSKIKATKDLLSLTCNDLGLASVVFTNKVYYKYNKYKTTVYYELADGTLLNLVTGNKEPLTQVFNAEGKVKVGVVAYQCFQSTPAGVKSGSGVFMDERKGLETIKNLTTSGTYDLYKDEESTDFKNVKLSARLNSNAASSCNIGQVRQGGIMFGELGGGQADGTFLARNVYTSQALESKFDISISPKALIGMFIQARPDEVKGAALVTDTGTILEIMRGKTILFAKDFENHEIKSMFKNASKYKDYILIYGDLSLDCPDILTDINTQKLPFDFNNFISTFEVMDIAKVDPSWKINGSIQMLQKAFIINKDKTVKYLTKTAEDFYTNKVIDSLFRKEASIPSLKDIVEGFLENPISKINPDYILHDKLFYQGAINKSSKTLFNAASKLAFEIEGTQRYVLNDMGSLFNNENENPYKIMDLFEVFIPGYEEYASTHGGNFKCIGMRYPMTEVDARSSNTILTLKQIQDRVDERVANKLHRKLIMQAYRTLSKGCIVTPSSDTIKKIHGGMDHDFDMMVVITDKELVDILWTDVHVLINIQHIKHQEEIVSDPLVQDFHKAKKAKAIDIRCNLVGFARALANQIKGTEISVGKATNMNSVMLAMLSDLEAARKAFERDYGHEGTLDYTPLKRVRKVEDGHQIDEVVIDENVIDRMIANISKCRFTDENLTAILLDIPLVFRFYIETIIDSAKTGLNANVKLKVANKLWARHLNKFCANSDVKIIDWKAKKVSLTESNRKNEINDAISDFKVEMAKRYAKALQVLVDDNDNIVPSEEMHELMTGITYSEKQSFDNMREIVKKAYRAFTALRAKAKSQNDDNMSDIEKAEIEAESDKKYAKQMEMLSNLARQITPELSMSQRSHLIKAAAYYNGEKNMVGDTGSQLASMICKPEFIAAVSEMKDSITVCGSALIANKGYEAGDIVSFKNGQAARGLILDDYTGDLEIVDHKGRLYATRKIKDAVSELVTIDDTSVMVVMKANSTKNDIMCEIADAKEIKLYAKYEGTYCAVVADGKVVGQFVNESKLKDKDDPTNQLYFGAVGTPQECYFFEYENTIGNINSFAAFNISITGRHNDFFGENNNVTEPQLVEASDIVDSDEL